MSRVARNALSAGTATVLARISGLLREVVFAAVFGAGLVTDAYLAAFRVPNLFRDLFAEGSMANAFVPNYAKVLEEEGKQQAFALANALLGVALLALGVVTVLMIGLAEGFVWMVAAGFADVPGKTDLTATLVRIVAPFLATISLASVAAGMLNVSGRFFLPALAPAAFNVAVIAACLAPPEWFGVDPIVLVAIASTLGGLAQFLVQLPSLHRLGFRLRPTLRGHPGLRRLLRFLGPAVIGIATIQLGVVVDVQLAATFGNGPVSWIGYAFRLVHLPMTIFAGAVAVASLAALSAEVARGERDKARATLGDAVSLTSFLGLPSALALGLFAEPLVALLFERGAFTPADTAATAALLRLYALGTFAFCLHRVVVPSFYAWGDAWTPMLLSIATVLGKIPLALVLTRPDLLGLQGIPLAHAIVASVEVGLLLLLLGRRAGGFGRRFAADHLRIAIAAGAMAATALLLGPRADGLAARLALLALSSGVYLGAAHLLGLPHVGAVLARLRPKRGLPPQVDAETAAALARHQGAALVGVEVGASRTTIRTDRGTLTLSASEGRLLARHADGTGAGTGTLALRGVLDLARRPPPLHGLEVQAAGQAWQLRASGDRVLATEAPGPRVAVA